MPSRDAAWLLEQRGGLAEALGGEKIVSALIVDDGEVEMTRRYSEPALVEDCRSDPWFALREFNWIHIDDLQDQRLARAWKYLIAARRVSGTMVSASRASEGSVEVEEAPYSLRKVSMASEADLNRPDVLRMVQVSGVGLGSNMQDEIRGCCLRVLDNSTVCMPKYESLQPGFC